MSKTLGEGTPYKKYTMELPKEQNLTVQGVGSPVPASVRGERAGHGTSLSCDRNTLGVGHLGLLTLHAPRGS